MSASTHCIVYIQLAEIKVINYSFSLPPAYIPTPIYFGAVIDTTCMLWQQDCGVHGSCWEYDVTSFRFVYFGLAASLKFVGFVFIFLTWYSIKHKEARAERWRQHLPPLGTVSELICHAGGQKSHARTRSCPVFIPPRPEPPAALLLNRGHSSLSCPGNALKAITPPILLPHHHRGSAHVWECAGFIVTRAFLSVHLHDTASAHHTSQTPSGGSAAAVGQTGRDTSAPTTPKGLLVLYDDRRAKYVLSLKSISSAAATRHPHRRSDLQVWTL